MGVNPKRILVFLKKYPKYPKQSQFKSFGTLKSAVHDKFTEVKLEFFSFIVGYVESCLCLRSIEMIDLIPCAKWQQIYVSYL